MAETENFSDITPPSNALNSYELIKLFEGNVTLALTTPEIIIAV